MIGILCITMTYPEIFGEILLVSKITRSIVTSTFLEKALKVLPSHFKFEQTFVYLLLIFWGRRYCIRGIKIPLQYEQKKPAF